MVYVYWMCRQIILKQRKGIFLDQSLQSWCQQHDITSLCIDSRSVKPGDCYVAYVNAHCDRRDFVSQAIELGASTVLYEAGQANASLAALSVPSFAVSSLYDSLASIAASVYGDSAQQMEVIAVTGTNGKSSIVYYLAQALTLLKHKTAMLGTFGNGFVGELTAGENTTPGVVELYQQLSDFKRRGAVAVALEASSHALVEGRLSGLAIDAAIFTQLSRDHLDFHGTMENYKAAKQKLFDWPGLKCGIFNIDDPIGKEWAHDYQAHYDVIATSCELRPRTFDHTIQLKSATITPTGTNLVVNTQAGQLEVTTRLLGEFNLSNLLAVIALLVWRDERLSDIAEVVAKIQPAPGRMQVIGGSIKAVVDYAHTPDALLKALQALRPYCQGQLWCVFGCGGDRDRGKRSQMAAIAEQYADQVVVTDDNPRTEDGDVIVNAIIEGFSGNGRYHVERDRAKAIELVCEQAKAGDVILIAGKGHEAYQIVGKQRMPFDDCDVVRSFLLD